MRVRLRMFATATSVILRRRPCPRTPVPADKSVLIETSDVAGDQVPWVTSSDGGAVLLKRRRTDDWGCSTRWRRPSPMRWRTRSSRPRLLFQFLEPRRRSGRDALSAQRPRPARSSRPAPRLARLRGERRSRAGDTSRGLERAPVPLSRASLNRTERGYECCSSSGSGSWRTR